MVAKPDARRRRSQSVTSDMLGETLPTARRETSTAWSHPPAAKAQFHTRVVDHTGLPRTRPGGRLRQLNAQAIVNDPSPDRRPAMTHTNQNVFRRWLSKVLGRITEMDRRGQQTGPRSENDRIGSQIESGHKQRLMPSNAQTLPLPNRIRCQALVTAQSLAVF